jgi:hypothetical protein
MNPRAHWFHRLLGPTPTLKELTLAAWGLFFAILILPTVSVVASLQQQGSLDRAYDPDFVYFYAMGRLLNDYPIEQLYDYKVQQTVCTKIHRLNTGIYGPIPYPPFVGLLFQPFALLPYFNAYLLWLAVSLILYLGGLFLIANRFLPHEPLERSLLYCLALSFYPFTIELMVNGQLSCIGFFALALAFYEEDRGSPLLSGIALSVCLYKPTLLVLFLPMLFIGRRWKTIIGFGIGGTALVILTTILKGIEIWPGFFKMLIYFGRASSGIDHFSILRLRKYVDITALSSHAPGGRSWPIIAVASVCLCWMAFRLIRGWWKAGVAKGSMCLIWATTLTWTLLVNVYVPLYDSILIVIGIVVTAKILKDVPDESLRLRFILLSVLTFASSWITERVANATGVQLITVILCALGVFQLALVRKIELSRQRQAVVAAGN